MMRVLLAGLGLLLVLLAAFVVDLLIAAGEFATLVPLREASCRRLAGVPGAEDVVIDREQGLALLASVDRRRGAESGAILGYDLESTSATPVDLTADFAARRAFQPLGMSLYRSPRGDVELFVINRRADGQTIEIFALRDRRLAHRETLSTEGVGGLNDLQAVGERSFYATQDHGAESGIARLVEDYTRRPWARVLFHDGHEYREAAGGLAYANGIALSPDGRTLYVAATTGKVVRVFDRDSAAETLSFRRDLPLSFGPDNLDVGPEGDLWVAGHPKLLSYTRYAAGALPLSPSLVVRIVDPASPAARVEPILVDSGALLSSSSVAAVYRDLFVVGSVLDDHVLVCRRS